LSATTATEPSASTIDAIKEKAKRLSILSMMSTTAAGSGHPTSCMSAAELVAGTFFYAMKFDPENPNSPDGDRFVLSKGHAAPVLYAAFAEAGVIPESRVMTLREFSSELEGHPTPRIPGVDAATGSLGQGLSVGAGLAIGAKMDKSPTRVYVMLGDGEMAEGQVWEAAAFAGHYKLENLTVLADVNALGQSEPRFTGRSLRRRIGQSRLFTGTTWPLCSLRWTAPKRRKAARKRSWRGRSRDTE
jgi:transketolase